MARQLLAHSDIVVCQTILSSGCSSVAIFHLFTFFLLINSSFLRHYWLCLVSVIYNIFPAEAVSSDGQNSLLKIDFYFQNRKYYFILYIKNTFEKYFAYN